MTENRVVFDDGAAYERFMGRWSRAAGKVFLDWIAPTDRARWLDVGCGTGVFTELVLNTCSPAMVTAVDPSPAQIEYAHRQPVAQRAGFSVADAQALPFSDHSFDVVASALVINFIPDRLRALAEMRRVSRPGGIVAGYVWDFAGFRTAIEPIRAGLSKIGLSTPPVPGAEDSTERALHSLFEQAGFDSVETRAIEVTVEFRDFDDYWQSQTPSFNPLTKVISAMPPPDREKLIEFVRTELPIGPSGGIAYSARANAVKGRAPF